MSEIGYWIWLSRAKQLSLPAAHRFLRHFGSVRQLYYAGEEEYRLVPEAKPSEIRALMNKRLDEAERIQDDCRRLGIRIVCLTDAAYPDRLRNIYDAPLLLYVKGSFPVVDDEPCVALVGTRKATPYGRRCARLFGADLAREGGIVVSGLAEGIDSEGMRAALEAGGTVIGVLGTGLDVTYPAWNGDLQEAVARKGALVSEYPPGTRASKGNFPARNRIISGLSVGVLVIEAPEKSGSLITAARAAEQGRDVYVVPGSIDEVNFVGSNLLIRDGAALVMSAWELLSSYRWRFPRKIHPKEERRGLLGILSGKNSLQDGTEGDGQSKKEVDKAKSMDYIDLTGDEALSEEERAVLAALENGPRPSDEIIAATGLEASAVLSALTVLELQGSVRRVEGERFEAAR